MTKVKDKVVWITGASSGIGEALAHELVRQGSKLILSARRVEELERVKKEIGKGEISILRLDLEKHETFKEAAETARGFYGDIDILINNGGISQRGLVKDIKMEVYRKVMEVNYFGTIGLTKTVLPQMIRNRSGHLVSISSTMGKIGTPLRSAYGASKHALHGFFECLRPEVYDDNIKVTIICPGFIHTNITLNALNAKGDPLNKMSEQQKHGISAEVAARKIVYAIEQDKLEYHISGLKEKAARWVYRNFPNQFAKIIRKVKST